MNDNPHSPEATEAADELGHPVRSFVVVLLLIGAALFGIQWSGAVSPQLNLSAGRSGEADGGREYRMVLLQNNGLLPLRVEAVDWPTGGWSDVRTGVLPAGVSYEGSHPSPQVPGDGTIEAFTIGGGFDEGRWIVVSGRPTCPSRPLSSSTQVHVRTWAGVERTVEVMDPMQGRSMRCPAPAEEGGEPPHAGDSGVRAP